MNANTAAWDSCFRKRLFFTREDAQAHMDRLWLQHGSHGLEVYPCEVGNGGPHFHVGHAPRQSGRVKNLRRLRTVGRQTVLTTG